MKLDALMRQANTKTKDEKLKKNKESLIKEEAIKKVVEMRNRQ